MKLGVLQFFSWPERRVPLETVFARALERIEIMDRTGYDAVWLAEHHFSSFSVCPSVHLMGTMAAVAHQAAAHRHRRLAGAVLSPAAARRGGGAARRAVGRPGQLGRRARLRAGRVREFRRASRREHVALSRGGRDRAARLDRGAAELRRERISASTGSRSCRSRCSARTRRYGWRRPRKPRSTGRRGRGSRF